jgi:hypothetical protein
VERDHDHYLRADDIEHPYQQDDRLDTRLRFEWMIDYKASKRRINHRRVSTSHNYHGELSRDDI